MNTLIELQIIAYIIQTKDLEIITSNGITPEDFSGEYQIQIAFIMQHQKEYGTTPDIITMIRMFPDGFEQLNITESPLYLEEQLLHHIRYRRTAKIVDSVKSGLVSAKTEEFDTAIRQLMGGLEEIDSGIGRRNLGTDISKDVTRLSLYQKRISGEIAPPKSFGIDALDGALKGILPDDLFVIFARSSHGKSYVISVLSQLLYAQGLNVLVYSGEMETEQVAYRFDTLQSGLSNNALMFGKPLYNKNNELVSTDTYKDYLGELVKRDNFYTVVTPKDDFRGKTPTVSDIEDVVKKLKPDVVFIDQLSLVRDQDKARTTREQYANIMRDFRLFSEVHQIPTFIAAQANREATEKDEEGGYKVPEPHQIAHADDVLHFATRVIGVALNRAENSTTHIMRMGVKKNRHAALTEFDMLVDFDKGIFEEYKAPETMEISDTDNAFKQFAEGTLTEGEFGF